MAAFAIGISQATTLRAYSIPTSSMAPTITPGDRICADNTVVRLPRRGEIWVFRLPPLSNLAVKRVVGLPGETIAVRGGRVWINGRPLAEPYLAAPPSYSVPPTRLAPDQYFVLGDNRNASSDSHVWGPLPADRLVGKVRFRFWPSARFKRF